MRLRTICFGIFLFFHFQELFALISIVQEPFTCAYTPNSILKNPPPNEVRYAGDRPRYSTCTGTSWFGGNHYLAAVNLVTSSIQIYQFDESTRSLLPYQTFNNSHGLQLARPENLSFSKDYQLLAIPNMRSGKVNIYKVGPDSFITSSPGEPIFTIQDKKVHGAQFSPTGDHLAYVSIDDLGGIYVYRISKDHNNQPTFTLSQSMKNAFYPLKPKSIDFSHDGRFVIIGYSVQISSERGTAKAVLVSYKFNAQTGKIDPKPISSIDTLFSTETVLFYSDSSYAFAVDQVNDKITAHAFDLATGKLGYSWTILKNPEAQLNFPHGIGLSSDGKYLSVSNYGEDKVTVYAIQRE